MRKHSVTCAVYLRYDFELVREYRFKTYGIWAENTRRRYHEMNQFPILVVIVVEEGHELSLLFAPYDNACWPSKMPLLEFGGEDDLLGRKKQ